MIRRQPGATRTDTLFPYTTLCRSVSAIFKKAKPGIVKETNARGLCPNMIFPMLRIRCNRHQRDNFGPKFFRSPSAFCKPMADPRLPFFVPTIRSEGRRVGKVCFSTVRYRWGRYHLKKNKKE